MKASHNFLKRYVKDLNVKGKEFAERITMTGTKVETFKSLSDKLSNIVVVKINKIEKHPDADKLVICKVTDGKDDIQIVTGAKNVYEGMLCPAVLPGGKVAFSFHDGNNENGIVIKKGKLRGVESFGMLCSVEELGLDKSLYSGVDGIFDFKDFDVKVGDDVIKAMKLDDMIYDFEITSNRIDCYSVSGIAKEVAATFSLDYCAPNLKFNKTISAPNYIKLSVENDKLCPAFYTRLIKNVKIKESPEWLKECLRAVGIRPINNFVDITNFVMMEMGQPMHAYDYKTINGGEITVKLAKDGDKFTTLDGQERILDKNVLTINDKSGAIGLAGIMGGENSMITEDAKDVLLEAANFDGVNIRMSSKRLGLRTEASNLFEKGLDANNAKKAIDRACSLIEELGIGDISEEEISFVSKNVSSIKNIKVSVEKINNLLGTDIDSLTMKKILDKIDLKTTIDNDILAIEVPTIRKDINNFADIAEEVARFYSYDNIGRTLPNVNINPRLKTNYEKVNDEIYNVAIYNGFDEIMNYSFESEKIYDKLMYKNDDIEKKYIRILNPLGEDFSIMRTQLVNGLLSSIATNYKKYNESAKLFEVANIYLPNEEKDILPNERQTFICGGYGKDIDFFYMKKISEMIFDRIGIKNNSYSDEIKYNFLHPYRRASILIGNEMVGYMGEVYEDVTKNYDIEKKVYILVLDIDLLSKYSNFKCKYETISKFPPIDRDLSFVIPKDMKISEVEKIIKKSSKLLNKCELFDIYDGKQLKEGFISIAYNFRFMSKENTLTDKEIDDVMNKIITDLEKIGAEIRK